MWFIVGGGGGVGDSSHSDRQISNEYLFASDFKTEKGMSSSEMWPLRASSTAQSAAWIVSNAHVVGNPEKNSLLPISD